MSYALLKKKNHTEMCYPEQFEQQWIDQGKSLNTQKVGEKVQTK